MPEDSIYEDIENENVIKYGLLLLPALFVAFINPLMKPLGTEIHGASSIVYLLLDPLFLYVPLINDDINCVTVDNRLKIAALVFRSFSDLRYVVRLFYHIRNGWRESKSVAVIATSMAVDFVSLLPIPQVLVLVFLPNMIGSSSLKIMKFLNFLVVLQYLFRGYPVYVVYKQGNERETRFEIRGIWIILNLGAFLLASHVFGAFWYLFSIQRQLDCWGYANTSYGSILNTSCDENALANVTSTHDMCPISLPDASIFDFGIFLYALQSGMQRSTNFPQKFLQCFSWGLRNLSSFASNLNGSSYGWENVFVIVISASGLVLFIYLLGYVQTYMQATSNSNRVKREMKDKVEPRISLMLSEYGLPKEMESKIVKMAKKRVRDDIGVVIENLFSILSKDFSEEATEIKSTLFINKLDKVEGIKGKSEEVHREIWKYLQPMMYTKGDFIIREGEPIDMLFFVITGDVLVYETSNGGPNGSSGTVQLEKEKDDMYGEELITWAEKRFSKLSNLPTSPITVKCHNTVEVFALQATDLKLIVSKFPSEFNMDEPLTVAVHSDIDVAN